MTFLGATASLFLKKASGSEGILALMQNVNFYLGGMLYLLAAVLNIYILKFLEYSVVLPLTSLTYIWTMALSYFVLKEKITGRKMLGVALILAGAVVVSM
ncbi:MAG: EamA family transporter [Lachnospiraceae bacterium]|nr:EamA family transporter [Lachnospiraceae bacterium]MCI8882088.1 EamA family transporter [Lachnospiraceae bacterium]